MAMNRWTLPLLRKLAACGLWLACLAAFSAVAGGRYCVVDGWGAGEGLLPQSAVISMVQTRDGYLWLGTRNGLARFDGVHFTVFDESTTLELSSIQIVKLFEDSQRNLWIGTESAGAMLVTNGQVLKLDFGQGRRRGHLVSLCQDSIGAVWMLTEDHELARYYRGNVDVWKIFGDSLTFGRAVIAEKSGLVWVGTDHILIGLDPAASFASKSPLPEKVRQRVGQLDFLLASQTGGYWRIADGIIEKCTGTNVDRNFASYPWAGDQDTVKAACEDREGNLIIGTHSHGVFWFDSQGHATQICTTNGLANDSVLSLVMDSEGSL